MNAIFNRHALWRLAQNMHSDEYDRTNVRVCRACMRGEREVRKKTANSADGRSKKYTSMRMYDEIYRIRNNTMNVPMYDK